MANKEFIVLEKGKFTGKQPGDKVELDGPTGRLALALKWVQTPEESDALSQQPATNPTKAAVVQPEAPRAPKSVPPAPAPAPAPTAAPAASQTTGEAPDANGATGLAAADKPTDGSSVDGAAGESVAPKVADGEANSMGSPQAAADAPATAPDAPQPPTAPSPPAVQRKVVRQGK